MANVLPSELMNSVLGKLYDALCSGDGAAPPSEDNYLAWVTPGIPFPPDEFDFLTEGLGGVYKNVRDDFNADKPNNNGETEEVDEDTSVEELNRMLADESRRKYIHAENLARLCDLIPDTSGTGTNSFNVWNVENTLSQAYEQVLRFSQVADVEPDERTKAKLEKLRSLMVSKRIEVDFLTDEERVIEEPSPLVLKYDQYLGEWEAAKLAYNTLRIEAEAGNDPKAVSAWAINGPILRRRVQAAERKWSTLGYREQFDRISAFIKQVEGRSIALLKQQYQELFEEGQLNSMLTGLPFHPVTFVPGGFARYEDGWTQFKFDSSDYASSYDYSKKGFGTKVKAGFGLWRAKAEANYDRTEIEHKINTSRFKLRFKIAQVPIIRPWFNVNFLTSAYWRFDEAVPDFNNQMVSDGAAQPEGMIPAFTTTAIFVRDLFLEFGESEYSYDSLKKHFDVSAGGGWGPFSVGGSYKQDNFERNVNSHREEQGIRIPGMQLIGFKCHQMPKSPNPNPSIKKWI
ncbi:hypothetical protein [Adonisia turfae]|nr:hypothetical protein [Adonisia turfae]